jgi:uncharacterized protein involved in type VI secretion and phage assembly
MNDETSHLFGKYRGRVIGNIDPMGIGRLQVQVPDVSGLVPTGWAMPCVPMAGPQAGMVVVPPVGSDVWVEFEQGDPDHPIWVGGFWSSAADMPAVSSSDSAAFAIRTPGQNGLTISDAPGSFGGIVLKSADGASLIVNDTGIHVQNGKGASITLVGPTVSVNLGALAVT